MKRKNKRRRLTPSFGITLALYLVGAAYQSSDKILGRIEGHLVNPAMAAAAAQVGAEIVAAFISDVERDLDRIASLQPNWDGYGAAAIAAEVINASRSFISALPSGLWPRPAVVPMSTGNLQFEWHTGGRILEIEVEDRETIHFLKWDPGHGIKEEDTFSIRDVDRAASLIRWFAEGAVHM